MRLQPVAEDTGDDVVRATRQESNDELDRARWIFVGSNGWREQRAADQAEQYSNKADSVHDGPSPWMAQGHPRTGSAKSEPSFGHLDGVAGAERIAQRQREARRHALHLARDSNLVLGRARREPAGDRDGVLDR